MDKGLHVEQELSRFSTKLPWGVSRERPPFPDGSNISTGTKPGIFALETLFSEFTVLAEKKVNMALEAPNQEKLLSKLLQRGEDVAFDQLLSVLHNVAENSLPSLLRALFDWYDRQNPMDETGNCLYRRGNKLKGEKEYLCEKRDLAIDFIFCLVLIEILKQLPYHPGHDELINHIISLAFRHFKYREGTQQSRNVLNISIVSDLYAEVIGVLAQTRFLAVKKRFMHELTQLRSKEQTQLNINSTISLLMGIKFFRVKMHPIEDFQASIQFLHELGQYFLDVKTKEIKHSLAGLFVEILLPVAAVVKNEVNVPVLKNLVETLYSPTNEIVFRKRHSLALFPMVTCLLCVSQKPFFLSNWTSFLNHCLSKLKDRDPTTARVAFESLYRLLWVYMIRVKCESNTATSSRLQSIISSLFPKGSRVIVPKEAPLNIFVKIVHFIAQERLDFAMKEVIFDLLGVGKNPKTYFAPERMCIGIRAFMVIADGLQQRDMEPPPMPQTIGNLPSGNTLRSKKTFISRFLSDRTAKMIGIDEYYVHVRKAFDAILNSLDVQVGRPMLLNKSENLKLEPDNYLGGERKPKIDLFRTCIVVLPRILPLNMSQIELIDLLSRLTLHFDDELGKLAFQSLQNIPNELPEWRHEIIIGFVTFIQRDVSDTSHKLLDQCNRRLILLLSNWRSFAQAAKEAPQEKSTTEQTNSTPTISNRRPVSELERNRSTLQLVEGLSLVLLCSCQPIIRKQAVIILKEVRLLSVALNLSKDSEPCVLDMLDRSVPEIIQKVLIHLPIQEKNAAMSAYPVDFQWLSERTSMIWTVGNAYQHMQDSMGSSLLEVGSSVLTLTGDVTVFDAWLHTIAIFMHHNYVLGHCTMAVQAAWPLLYSRLQIVIPQVEPTLVLNDRSSSLLRSRRPNERELHITLWKSYIVMACCIAPPSHPPFSHDIRATSPELLTPDVNEKMEILPRPISPGMTARELFRCLLIYIKCDVVEMRETTIFALGHINATCLRDLIEELNSVLKEATDRRAERQKGRKKRDILRLCLVRLFHYIAENGAFAIALLNSSIQPAMNLLIEFIDGMRLILDVDTDKDAIPTNDIRLYFTKFLLSLIRNTPVGKRHKLLSQDLRADLCILFSTWTLKFGLPSANNDKTIRSNKSNFYSDLEICAVEACAATLCCGPVYDPSGLNEGGDIYLWINKLFNFNDEKIYKLVEETIVLLLEFNQEAQTLLDWVIDRCYTGSHEVADCCFNALSSVFTAREYPCDQISMINVVLMCCNCPRWKIQSTALQLFKLLYKRFILDDFHHSINIQANTSTTDDDSVFWDENGQMHNESPSIEAFSMSNGSQIQLSTYLAATHPDLTMPIFSEIMHRVSTARNSIRQNMLRYLIPWMHNIELADPTLPSFNRTSSPASFKDIKLESSFPLKGSGWGTVEATNMTLNNLFYTTCILDSEHGEEIEKLWAALVHCWTGNLVIIVRYIIIIVSIHPNVFLPHARKVLIFIARVKKCKLLEEVINELRIIEPFHFNIERSEAPPFYRFCKRQTLNAPDGEGSGDFGNTEPVETIHLLNKGQIQMKKPSGEEVSKIGTNDLISTQRLRTSPAFNGTKKKNSDGETMVLNILDISDPRLKNLQPHPLPMPAYGGYYAPLSKLFTNATVPNPPYQRCNIAVMLLPDLVNDKKVDIDWTPHIPIILHIIFLGLDNNRLLVHECSKELLLQLLLSTATKCDQFIISRIIIANQHIHDDSFLFLPKPLIGKDHSYLDEVYNFSKQSLCHCVENLTTDTLETLPNADTFMTIEQVYKALVEFLITRKSRPLWSYEDITSKVHKIKSAEDIEHLLKCIVKFFKLAMPLAHINLQWAQEAIHISLSCSSRHYAGRSFQIFRALQVSFTANDLCDILSRLIETVADQGDDMQGYVTEIMLTLESVVDHIDIENRPLLKDFCVSTPNLAKTQKPPVPAKNVVMTPMRHVPQGSAAIFRSGSCSKSSFVSRKNIVSMPPMQNHREDSLDERAEGTNGNLLRSQSSMSLKQLQDPQQNEEDRLAILALIFWIGVLLMESDFEYEYLLAIKLIDKTLNYIQPNRSDCRERLEKILHSLYWHDFPGVQAFLLKGLTSSQTVDATWMLLNRLSPHIMFPIIDPSGGDGLPMNIISLLPRLIEKYDAPTNVECNAAISIAEMCRSCSTKLEPLATVMVAYGMKSFKKECSQWTKCVIKYLYDEHARLNDVIIVFLTEILEKGPLNYQAAVLQILHCILQLIDVSTSPSKTINMHILRVVSRFVENNHWKEAQQILKLCVVRSSSFVAVPPNINRNSIIDGSCLALPSFISSETKKELPGRTLDFKFDQQKVPIIGNKYWDIANPSSNAPTLDPAKIIVEVSNFGTNASGIDNNQTSSWRKPMSSQARTRERLVSLLNCYGPRVIPKSPSVVFEQASPGATLERAPSITAGSSSEETSAGDSILPGEMSVDDCGSVQRHIQSVFDFLEEPDSGCEYWGVNQPHTLKVDNYEGNVTNVEEHKESSDEETQCASPMDNFAEDNVLPSSGKFSRRTLHDPRFSIFSSTLSIDMESSNESKGGSEHENSVSPNNINNSNSSHEIQRMHPKEVEVLWNSHFNKIVNEKNNSCSHFTFNIFYRLFLDIRTNLSLLAAEIYSPLSRNQFILEKIPLLASFKSMANQLDCPLVFTDQEAMIQANVFEKHRLYVSELHENHENFVNRRARLQALHNELQASERRLTPADPAMTANLLEQKIEMIYVLYLAHSQLIQLLDNFSKLIAEFYELAQPIPQVVSLSTSVKELNSELRATYDVEDFDMDNSSNSVSYKQTSAVELERLILQFISSQNYSGALQAARQYCDLMYKEETMPSKLFGCIEAVIHIYCKNQSNRAGYLAICPPSSNLDSLRSQLMEVKVQISNARVLIHHRSQSPRGIRSTPRNTDLSYL